MNVPNGGLNTFAAQIVSGFGFAEFNTTLIGKSNLANNLITCI